MERFKNLVSSCKCSVSISVNKHRDYYETAAQHFDNLHSMSPDLIKDIDKNTMDKMVEYNTIVNISFYPDTPVGFYAVYHYDLDLALDIAVKIIEDNK